VRATCARFGLRLAVMLHDLIPLRRPEWCDPQVVLRFTRWSDALLAGADLRLANSEATARDMRDRCAALGLADTPVHILRFGDGYSPNAGPPPDIEGRYALFVSTLERRKNHALLVEVWRRLLQEMGPQAVPRLVLVGREGPLVADLLATLRASRFLDGHIIWRQHTTDAELTSLYAGCDFTLFPSLYEGWGLPVAESLSFGKPCLASNATSVPEVGGALVRYFDPMNVSDALRVIGDVARAPERLPAWAAEVRATFRTTPWKVTAARLQALVRDGSANQL
jgi:glycosyltransferase involved in cell wall biosynthesis